MLGTHQIALEINVRNYVALSSARPVPLRVLGHGRKKINHATQQGRRPYPQPKQLPGEGLTLQIGPSGHCAVIRLKTFLLIIAAAKPAVSLSQGPEASASVFLVVYADAFMAMYVSDEQDRVNSTNKQTGRQGTDFRVDHDDVTQLVRWPRPHTLTSDVAEGATHERRGVWYRGSIRGGYQTLGTFLHR